MPKKNKSEWDVEPHFVVPMPGPSPQMTKNSQTIPLRLGISRCLLGDPVRYDGGHKRDRFLVDILGPHVEWVPVCPEVEAGFGTPREPMRLVDDPDDPRLITIGSGEDRTDGMRRYTIKRLRDLRSMNLSGYVFKNDSPSCGVQRVPIYTRQGHRRGKGKGIFAARFQRLFPLIPIEDESRLHDRRLRENFIERMFGYHRWQSHVLGKRLTRGAVAAFHAAHTSLLLAHSRSHYQRLNRLVAKAQQVSPRQLADSYGQVFMAALAVPATARTHLNALRHLADHLNGQLNARARADLFEVVQNYHRGCVPLSVPIALIRHYVRVLDIPCLRNQVYLAPHPTELMSRTHV